MRADEIENAVALWTQAGLTRPWNDPRADFNLALRTPTSTIIGAFVGDRLFGSVMAGFDGHRAWVYYLSVAEDARKSGLGEQLMRAAEDFCARLGAPKMNLMVRGENTGVIAFYEKIGYARSDIVTLQRVLEPEKT
jgi:ribosomal protein S18 acetylase RimI-like enzyme